MTFSDFIGLLGVALYLFAYLGLQFGRFKNHDNWYLGTNIAAGVCTIISLIYSWNLAAFISNLCWITISLSVFVKKYFKRADLRIIGHQTPNCLATNGK